jgi:diacylglycerol O-acyltransferase
MADRLGALDLSFLYLEEPTTPMHVGSVAIFRPPADGFDVDSLVGLVEQRLALVPRYRKIVRRVPGGIARPVWVDDADFDVMFHVRRSALPRPGSDAQLREFVARIMSRRLDRSRPLWEMYLVEGLARNRVAIVTKSHAALVDGVSAVDIGQVILDVTPKPRDVPEDLWMPEPDPGSIGLVVDALGEVVRSPSAALDAVRMGLVDARATAGTLARGLTGLLAAATTAARPAPVSPLNAEIGEQRRYAVARTDLDDYRRVRKAHGATVNDVVLATIAGALRQWLLTRGEPVTSTTVVRAMVPMSVRGDGPGALGNRVASYLVDLPVGEPNPVIRLHQLSFAMRAHRESGQSVGADAMVRISGFAPPTLHALGAKAASQLSRRLFNLVVTNVPGPQVPLYAAGARMLEVFPVVPLARGQAVSVGLTSYDGKVYFGLNADRDAMGDVEVLADLLVESLAELVETVR